MTIIDILEKKYSSNPSVIKSLEIIKDNFINLVNDNYELVLDVKGQLQVRIPSLQNRNDYEYKDVSDYEYPLVMCMRISEIKNKDIYKHIIAQFIELYKDKLDVFFKDVSTVDKLVNKIKDTKKIISFITYISIFVVIFASISLCVFLNLSNTMRYVIIIAIIGFFLTMIIMQFTKEERVKRIVDGYISIIKTDWYQKELNKQNAFFCHLIE
ncbi:hypothetical protein FDE76_10990 [Clostridium botulinum]|uniref:Uncharacterized protein n=1 Tax=Clostridium botulinum (strain Eklund 17B / Type B) TaxID=935198 RepID=B2TRA3_CLOBB|nr:MULTISPECIES: hypothetical protein [unclassified Clostridium]ACD23774.1 hypothetical protein CLL_A3524 [Clostridium botulinum B str. Eklund 17B (NRP)]MBN1040119.1 hypothetical protein [Clostridium botulinum]MBN1053588.1 hypothetical protein [Clostridium botulinum]MBN1056791.1 hypothetical protein [Clostridium botulinum]MBN1069325.1 hypothetical protein [Clostridium botulinum]